MIEGFESGAGSKPLTNGSRYGRPENIRIRQIRTINTTKRPLIKIKADY